MGGIGLLVLLDPNKANVRLALLLTAALPVTGLLQVWSVLRVKAPESVDTAAGARAAIGVCAGVIVLVPSGEAIADAVDKATDQPESRTDR